MKFYQLLRTKRRGQLNIAEVVICAAIILVLMVSISQTLNQIAVKPASQIDYKTLGDDILLSADNSQLLRPVIYNFANITVKTQLADYIMSFLPLGVEYSLVSVNNTSTSPSLSCLVGICPTSNPTDTNTYTSTLYLSFYVNPQQKIEVYAPMVAQLFLYVNVGK